MTRSLVLTCNRRGCKAEARVELHGTQLLTLPAHWRLVATSYDGHGEEFCSLACVSAWATTMAAEHERRQRDLAPADQQLGMEVTA